MTLDGGFEPGKTYEVSYRAANPPVAGLGFVAVRDTTAWLKHQPEALASVRFAYGYGSSQSGRFIRSFIHMGFNADEKGRVAFDGHELILVRVVVLAAGLGQLIVGHPVLLDVGA